MDDPTNTDRTHMTLAEFASEYTTDTRLIEYLTVLDQRLAGTPAVLGCGSHGVSLGFGDTISGVVFNALPEYQLTTDGVTTEIGSDYNVVTVRIPDDPEPTIEDLPHAIAEGAI